MFIQSRSSHWSHGCQPVTESFFFFPLGWFSTPRVRNWPLFSFMYLLNLFTWPIPAFSALRWLLLCSGGPVPLALLTQLPHPHGAALDGDPFTYWPSRSHSSCPQHKPCPPWPGSDSCSELPQEGGASQATWALHPVVGGGTVVVPGAVGSKFQERRERKEERKSFFIFFFKCVWMNEWTMH